MCRIAVPHLADILDQFLRKTSDERLHTSMLVRDRQAVQAFVHLGWRVSEALTREEVRNGGLHRALHLCEASGTGEGHFFKGQSPIALDGICDS